MALKFHLPLKSHWISSVDSELGKALKAWHEYLEVLGLAEEKYLSLEVNEKHLFAKLFLAAEGKNIMEKESAVYASSEWTDFKFGWAMAKSEYNRSKRELDYKIKRYEATYLTYKLESEAVRKQPS